MIILGVFTGHDAGAALFDDYMPVAAVALERMTRIKSDGGRFPDEAVDECLKAAALTRANVEAVALPTVGYPGRYFTRQVWWDRLPFRRSRSTRSVLRQMIYQRVDNPALFFSGSDFLSDHGFNRNAQLYFYNHHTAHALAALFHTDWDDALAFTADGGGDRIFYSARLLSGDAIKNLFGHEAQSRAVPAAQSKGSSLALLYAEVTRALGFKPLRHEGKVLGLAASGEPRFAKWFRDSFHVLPDGQVRGRRTSRSWQRMLGQLAQKNRREDIAASVQSTVEDVALDALRAILRHQPTRRLGVAGGLFANVRLNQRMAEECGLDELFVYPAMSDQGESAGGCLEFLLARDGLAAWLRARRRLNDVYLGHDYTAQEAAAFTAVGAIKYAQGDIARAAAGLIHGGAAVGTFLGRMEYGPRALGARSIMAPAIDRSTNESLNRRLSRTEFMPFAPVVRAERADEVFDLSASLRYAANFMTTTCRVRPEWRGQVPAIVHVDGTARPQLISRDQNAVYYDILAAYEKLSGLPVLINTSFNAHEEPIINTPEECATALRDDRVDAVTTRSAIWVMPNRPFGNTSKDRMSFSEA